VVTTPNEWGRVSARLMTVFDLLTGAHFNLVAHPQHTLIGATHQNKSQCSKDSRKQAESYLASASHPQHHPSAVRQHDGDVRSQDEEDATNGRERKNTTKKKKKKFDDKPLPLPFPADSRRTSESRSNELAPKNRASEREFSSPDTRTARQCYILRGRRQNGQEKRVRINSANTQDTRTKLSRNGNDGRLVSPGP
jgi:hypothetical protein